MSIRSPLLALLGLLIFCGACKKERPPVDPALGPELIAALEQSDAASAGALIARGADPNARQQGTAYTPYVLAAKQCLTGVVRELDAAGADLTLEVASANTVARSAFLNAAMNGCLDTVKYFVEEKKVDINTRHHVWNETLLHKAVQRRDLSLARYALEQGVDRGLMDNNGRTAYALAKEVGAVDIAELIEKYPGK